MNLDLKKITKDDIFYYVLPEGSTLYKGLVNEERVTNIANYEWYGMSEKVAEIYGHIYLYVLKKQVLLYAMDERSNVEQLLRDARAQSRNDVVEAIKDTFQLFPDTNEVIRHSDPDNDKIVAEFICLNKAGYAAEQLRKWKDSANYFHSEIMLNNANTLVEYLNKKIKTSVSSTAVSNRLAPKKAPRPVILRSPTIQRRTPRKLFVDEQDSSPFKMRRVENNSFEDFQPLFSPEKHENYLLSEDENVENAELSSELNAELSAELNAENWMSNGFEESGDEGGERGMGKKEEFDAYNNMYDANQESYLQRERNEELHEQEHENSFSHARKNLFSQFEEARVLF